MKQPILRSLASLTLVAGMALTACAVSSEQEQGTPGETASAATKQITCDSSAYGSDLLGSLSRTERAEFRLVVGPWSVARFDLTPKAGFLKPATAIVDATSGTGTQTLRASNDETGMGYISNPSPESQIFTIKTYGTVSAAGKLSCSAIARSDVDWKSQAASDTATTFCALGGGACKTTFLGAEKRGICNGLAKPEGKNIGTGAGISNCYCTTNPSDPNRFVASCYAP